MKKKNSRVTLRESDIRKIKRECIQNATNYVIILVLSVFRDEHKYGKKRLTRVLNQIDSLADSVSQGSVKLDALRRKIEDECGIVIFNRSETYAHQMKGGAE